MVVMKHYELGDLPDIQKVGVYAIHNKRTDRYYVGSTKNLYHRFTLHMRVLRHQTGINRKMDEDFESGCCFDDFEWIIIEEFEDYTITNIELRRKEWYYIKFYQAIENGYNTDNPNPGNIPDDELLAPHDYMSERMKNSLTFYVPKSLKEKSKMLAKKQGKTVSAYVIELLERDIKEKAGNRQ